MLPAPTTIAIWTPLARTAANSPAIRAIVSGSCPYSRSPSSASPESLIRTRWNGPRPATDGAGSLTSGVSNAIGVRFATRAPSGAALVAGEALDLDVLARLGG